jgi:hypothetical protein
VAALIGCSPVEDDSGSGKGGGVGDSSSSSSSFAPVPRNSRGGGSSSISLTECTDNVHKLLRGVKRSTRELHKALQMWRVQCGLLNREIQSQESKVAALQAEMTRLRVRPSQSQTSAQRRLSMKVTQKELDKISNATQRMRQRIEATPSEWKDALQGHGQFIMMLGAALALLLPSRFCCSNPCCINLSTVSESFRLARGAASACGGCLSGGKQPAHAHCFAAR